MARNLQAAAALADILQVATDQPGAEQVAPLQTLLQPVVEQQENISELRLRLGTTSDVLSAAGTTQEQDHTVVPFRPGGQHDEGTDALR